MGLKMQSDNGISFVVQAKKCHMDPYNTLNPCKVFRKFKGKAIKTLDNLFISSILLLLLVFLSFNHCIDGFWFETMTKFLMKNDK